jgi:predicted nucleic acid-binding protein
MACADSSDPHHGAARQARDAWLSAGGIIVTTDYIVDETLTLIRVRLGLRAARTWWEQVGMSRRVRFERIEPHRAEAALEVFFAYENKDFSLTDCTSFVVMKELKLKQALTTDNHFVQMGFQCLPVKAS